MPIGHNKSSNWPRHQCCGLWGTFICPTPRLVHRLLGGCLFGHVDLIVAALDWNQAATGTVSRSYSINNPPSLAQLVTAPDRMTGSERAIGVLSSSSGVGGPGRPGLVKNRGRLWMRGEKARQMPLVIE